ncbi:MAG: 16S rRNA (adenine(1518)-N(6)/adenine(1519)-N(6))-dimethyltransferase RsmA [Myxococcota bacterium]
MKQFETPGELVRTYQHHTKKRFGQHFLVDPNILERIADAAGVEPGDDVLEIGPGCGTLTLIMLERGAHVTAVEVDRDLAEFLRTNLVPGRELELIESDVLKADIDAIVDEERAPWKCAANLPYNVATEVFFRLAEHAERFDTLALMFQKEVAERFVARAGEDDYSVLSLMGRLYFDSEIAFTLPGGAFVPPPRVSSAVVRFEPVPGTRIARDDVREMFVRVVKKSFQKRRKTLPNAMAGVGFPKDVLKEVIAATGLDLRIRPERVTFGQFATIAEALVERDSR